MQWYKQKCSHCRREKKNLDEHIRAVHPEYADTLPPKPVRVHKSYGNGYHGRGTWGEWEDHGYRSYPRDPIPTKPRGEAVIRPLDPFYITKKEETE